MRSGNPRPRVVRFGARRELTLFVGGGLLTTVAVGVAAACVCHSIADQQALDDYARTTEQMSSQVIGPLAPGYLAQDPAEMAALDRVVHNGMSDDNLIEVTIWSADGTVLYSDRANDIGKTLPPSKELLAATAGRTTSAWEDDPPEADATSAAEALASTADDNGPRRFVEVYAPMTSPAGHPWRSRPTSTTGRSTTWPASCSARSCPWP
jgi:hypothetical protein